jgi:hypothetical protein
VSGECVATCPAPLINCNNQCVNPDDSNANCGGCNKPCTGNNGCSAGACVPVLGPYSTPPKCIGGGPPIIVPTDGNGGGQQCTGNLGAVAFTYGMCSRTNIGPLSQQLYTDAFDSNAGAYKATCSSDADCDSKHCALTHAPCSSSATCTGGTGDTCVFPVKCVLTAGSTTGVCVGGGVGLNGTVTPVASDTANTHVGGDFWVYGLNGVNAAPGTALAMKGATQVKQRFINLGTLDLSKTSRVYGAAFVTGAWSAGGNADMTIDGLLTTTTACTPTPPLPSNTLHLNGGCTTAAYPSTGTPPAYPFTTGQPPCGALDGSDGSLLKIKELVNYFKDPAHNDNNNVSPAIAYSTFDTGSTTIRLDLPCGYYYFNSLNIGKDTTIVVHGRTAIIVAGAMRVSQKLIFDLDPGATLDLFVGGVVSVSNVVTLGSPAYPRKSRLWIGSASCLGSGSCTNDTQCCSGVCSAGTCTAGGGNLSQSMSLSNGGNFNGLIWAGYGSFTHSNPLEMYGSIYTNHFDASGDTIVHYDIGATEGGEECPPPPVNAACESCRNCNNQPCLLNGQGQLRCGSPCTLDSQCCSPLHCDVPTGVCKL